MYQNCIIKIKSYLLDQSFSRIDYIIVFLYTFLVLVVGVIFHEPWFDESTAWMIARTNSVADIIFNIPHYEGHFPSWHLLLKLIQLTNLPYELSLVVINLIFLVPAIILLVHKSRFPRLIRWGLCFSYFLFYQYGVISRPYSMMILAFMILAFIYNSRNICPIGYTLTLLFLSSVCVYGLIFACGISCLWLMEIIGSSFSLKDFFKDKRTHLLGVLLITSIFLLSLILPRTDSSTALSVTSSELKNSFLINFFYMFFSSISDALVTSSFNSYTLLQIHEFNWNLLAVSTFIGILALISILKISLYKRTTLLFFVPYLLFCLFSSCVYFYLHHIGIVFIFLLFWGIVSFNSKEEERDEREKIEEIEKIKETKSLNFIFKPDSSFYTLCLRMICFILCIQIYWSIFSVCNDIKYPYSSGRQISNFIKAYNLDKYRILSQWQVVDNIVPTVLKNNTNNLTNSSSVLPYFDKDILINFDSSKEGFNPHKLADWKTNQQRMKDYKKEGFPQVLLFGVSLDLLYQRSDLSYRDYTAVLCTMDNKIFKDIVFWDWSKVFIQKDLLKKLDIPIRRCESRT